MYTNTLNQDNLSRPQFTASLDFSSYRRFQTTRANYPVAEYYPQHFPMEECFYQPMQTDDMYGSFWGAEDCIPTQENPHHQDIQINIRHPESKPQENQRYFYLEDLYKGGDKDFDDLIMSSTGLKEKSKGVFQTSPDGRVKIDYLLDRGAYKGELAIFSLEGMEHLDRNSDEFREEATRRAKSNSIDGRIIVSDIKENGSLEGGRGAGTFQFRPKDNVAFVFLGNSSFEKLGNSRKPPKELYLSTGSRDGFDHFKTSDSPTNLSSNGKEAIDQLINASRSARGVLA